VLAGRGNDGGVGNWDSTVLLGSFAFGNFAQGSIAEVMAYDHVLSTSELASLHTYLLPRYHGAPPPMIAWRALPQPAQILQRDASDRAVVAIDGDVLTTGYSGITVEITQDGQPYDSRHEMLTYSSGQASFSFQPEIAAGLHDYSVVVLIEQGLRRRLLAQIDHVACGDVYLVNGQSNAAAADYWGEGLANALQSPWIRSFGTASIAGDVTFDLHWDRADGESYLWHCSIGQWALKLASKLVHDEQLPIAMLNGAVGGTSSSQHLRNDSDHDDLTTIYGRLLYRAEQAGVVSQAPMMLWYQGESDGDDGIGWARNFGKIHDAWLEDYPALVGVDLFQIRDNCAGGGREVRERQRTMPEHFADCYVMSTTGAPGHDGCHFMNNGYFALGTRLARAIERDRYGSSVTLDVDAPAIVSATWNDVAHTQILLTFANANDTLHFDAGAEANFFTDDGVAVTSGTVLNNTVLLQLAQTSSAVEINYDGHPLDGPWLANARNVGALTFFHVKVQ
jgi:hypothetical protein